MLSRQLRRCSLRRTIGRQRLDEEVPREVGGETIHEQLSPIGREHRRDITDAGETRRQCGKRPPLTRVERHGEQRQRFSGPRAVVDDQVPAVCRPRGAEEGAAP